MSSAEPKRPKTLDTLGVRLRRESLYIPPPHIIAVKILGCFLLEFERLEVGVVCWVGTEFVRCDGLQIVFEVGCEPLVF